MRSSIKIVVLVGALALALMVGALAGGGILYALTRNATAARAEGPARLEPQDVLALGFAAQGEPEEAEEPEELEDEGLVVVHVERDGPAAQAGVTRGDILLELDGETLEHPWDLQRLLEDRAPGSQVELRLTHGDEERTLTATLGGTEELPDLGLQVHGGFHFGALRAVKMSGDAVILEIVPDSPAAAAGLAEGDVIVAVDGQELDGDQDLAELVRTHQPGDTITLRVERPGEEARDVAVQLGEHPDEAGAPYLGIRYGRQFGLRAWRGLEGEEGLPPFEGPPLDFELPEFRELIPAVPEGVTQGIVVGNIEAGGPAEAAGLRENDVITAVDGEPVEGPQSLGDAAAERQPGDTLTLTVVREGEEARDVQVTLGEDPNEAGKAYLGIGAVGFFFRHSGEGEEWPTPGMREEFFRDALPDDFDFDLPPLPFDESGPGDSSESA